MKRVHLLAETILRLHDNLKVKYGSPKYENTATSQIYWGNENTSCCYVLIVADDYIGVAVTYSTMSVDDSYKMGND